MAAGRVFVCGNCGHAIEAWDEGNPYWIDEAGAKHYAYHPDMQGVDRCVGNDSPHLCLACGRDFMSDSRAPSSACPSCGAEDIVATWMLDGRPCPYCKKGTFGADPDRYMIS
ncbi:MAG: hypothetical protein HY812_17180 [Planctomycetes bacterium]|nr:hypothetical protein [Planctomycetota bacterium]